MDFSFLALVWLNFGKCVSKGCNNSNVSTRREKLVGKRDVGRYRSSHSAGVRVGRYRLYVPYAQFKGGET